MMPQQEPSGSAVFVTPQNCVARALYDNIAESPDELAFRKGDLLTVLEQNTGGIEGWWLCSLRGRQGICPGNRLRLLAGVYRTEQGLTTLESMGPDAEINLLQRQGKRRSWHVQPNKVITPQKVGDVYLYDLPPNRGSPSQQPKYDVPPTTHISVVDAGQGSYDVPRTIGDGAESAGSGESYDVPRSQNILASYDTPRSWKPGQHHARDSIDSYDVPRPHPAIIGEAATTEGKQEYDVPRLTPSSSASSLTAASDSVSLSLSSAGGSNRSSLEHPVYVAPSTDKRRVGQFIADSSQYDIPRPVGNVPLDMYDQPRRVAQDVVYDVPPQVTRDITSVVPSHTEPVTPRVAVGAVTTSSETPVTRELPLELGSAVDTLVRLQQEVHSSITRLLGFVSPNWRCREKFEGKVYEVKLAVVRMRTSLQDFVEFAEGSLGNARRAADKTLAPKLQHLIQMLQDSNKLVQEAASALDAQEWSITALARPDDSGTPDSLDQLVACARALTEDVRQTSSFIQGNSTLLFKRSTSSPMPETPPKKAGQEQIIQTPLGMKPEHEQHIIGKETMEDYDYVNLESRESVAKQHAEIRDALPADLRKSYDTLIKESEVPVDGDHTKIRHVEVVGPTCLDPNDKQVLQFYAAQTVNHVNYLTNAIDAFLLTIEHNQPPKIFLAHSKFVVLSAHKLVNIGDTVFRNVVQQEVRNKVLHCANRLSEALNATVQKTKKAALQFPSVTAVQEMVDSVVDISHLARDLKVNIVQAAQY